jgi:hypothetical protein
MLPTGPFLALAFFFFAFFARAFTEARPALRAISRRRFALQNRISLSSISVLVFFDSRRSTLSGWTASGILFTGSDVLLDQLAHSCVYRLPSGGYALFQIQRVGLKLRGLEQLTPVTHGASR